MPRILLDQNLAHDLRELLIGHEAKVAYEMGWDRLSNGDLLTAAEEAGFDVLLTADRSIRYQNRLSGRRIAVVELSTNNWPTRRANIQRVLQALERVAEASYQEMVLQRPPRRRRQEPGSPVGPQCRENFSHRQ